MTPRLPSSKKWTNLPYEYTDQIRQVFTEAFEDKLKDCVLHAEGRIYPEEILLRVGFREPGRLKQNNFEASMKYSKDPEDALIKIGVCVDAIAVLVTEFFNKQDIEDSEEIPQFPLVWTEMKFEKETLFFQYSSENTDLEAEANRLLGADADSEEGFAQGDWEATVEDSLEDSAPPTPTMFKGKKKKTQLH
jgi:hypothetical protein